MPGGFGAEERDDLRHVGRLGDPSQHRALLGPLDHLGRELFQPLGAHEARRDGIHIHIGRTEIHRSGRTPLDPDHVETQVEVERQAPHDEPGGGPIPEGNQPGHHPEHDQDKPDLDEFAAKFGTAPPDERASTDDAPAPEDDTADDDTDGDAGAASSGQSADRDEGSSRDDDRSTAETVTSMMSSGLSAGASVAGSACWA